jgi:hypothetical protein
MNEKHHRVVGEVAVVDANTIPQPNWANLFDAFVHGAQEARANQDAGEHDFRRAADGYCKRVLGDLPVVPALVPAGQVVAWMWQHEETGNVGFIDQWQIDNGWQAANPRLRLIRPLVFAPGVVEPLKGDGDA